MGNATRPDTVLGALRLAWAERMAQKHGTVSRQDLMQAFRISIAQASSDLQELQRVHPGCLTYSTARKRYEWVGTKLITKLPYPVRRVSLVKPKPIKSPS